MVRIVDSAQFDRNALLGDAAEMAYRLNHPKENYLAATEIVHSALRAEARRQDSAPFEGNGGRPGRTVTGMGTSQAISLIWPQLSKAEHDRARTAVTAYLRASDNAACLEQGRARTLPQWWVADEWRPIEPAQRPRKRPVVRRRVDPELTPAPAPELAPAPAPELAPEPTPAAEPARVLALPLRSVDLLSVPPDEVDPAITAIGAIEEMCREMKLLRDENQELRSRLEKISTAIAGLNTR